KSSAACSTCNSGWGMTAAAMVSRRTRWPSSSMSRRTAAISSRACSRALKPPVSTSTTTGRKPRNRLPRVVRLSRPAPKSISLIAHPPMKGFTGHQRHHGVRAQGHGRGQLPGVLLQGDGGGVARQAVEVGAVETGKGFEPVQGVVAMEEFRIQFHRRVMAVATGTAAGGFLALPGVRGGVGAEEKLRAAAEGGGDQRVLV